MQSNNSPYFPGGLPSYRFTSGLAGSPLKTSGEETQKLFFDGADSYYVNGVEIIYENDVSPGVIAELFEFEKNNTSALYEDEPVASPYSVKVFVSKDDSYLRQAFDKTEPLANEVCIFLEDNSTDYISGGSAYVKVGDNLREDLTRLREIAKTEADNMQYFSFINDNNETDLSIDFTQDQIEELIATGEISNAVRTTIIGIVQVINFGSFILTPIYKILGDGISAVTGFLRKYIKLQDHHWDPEAAQGNRFEPFFCPIANELVDTYEWAAEAMAEKVHVELLKQLELWKNSFHSSWNTYSKLSGGKYAIPEGITLFLKKCEERIIQLIDQQQVNIEFMLKVFISIGEKFINAVNAFYCGLWNSLVEAVLGMVDTVAFIFKGLALIGDAIVNAQTLVPQALELMDELIQAMMRTDYSELISAACKAIQDQLATIDFTTIIGSISVEKTAYFLGACIGYIVEIVAGIIYSGGLEALASTLRRFGKVGTDVLQFVTASTAKTFGEIVALSADSMIAIVRKVVDLLKKGKDEVVKFINDIFQIIKKGAKLTDEIILEIMKKFGFTNVEKQLIDDLGMAFVNYSGDACSICKKTP
ncbi:MAG: hypothetical protein WCF67_04845 [Chitinophagaceae bacterium]